MFTVTSAAGVLGDVEEEEPQADAATAAATARKNVNLRVMPNPTRKHRTA